MSTPASPDPRHESGGMTDENLIAAHERAAAGEPDTHARYRLLPLVLLFIFSGLIFYAGIYLHHNSGYFSASIFDERQAPTDGQPVVAAVDPLVLGQRLYSQQCAICHTPTGGGMPGIYPSLAGSGRVLGDPEKLARIVLHGFKGPIEGKTYSGGVMPSFGPGGGYNWGDDRIAAVLTYVRQQWGNDAGPVATELVTAVRTQVGTRGEWTEEELLALP